MLKKYLDPNKPLEFEDFHGMVTAVDGLKYDDMNEFLYLHIFDLCGCGTPEESLIYLMSALKTLTDEKTLKTNVDYFEAFYFINVGLIDNQLNLTVLGNDVIKHYSGEFIERNVFNQGCYLNSNIDLSAEFEVLGVRIQPEGWVVPTAKYIDKLSLYYDMRSSDVDYHKIKHVLKTELGLDTVENCGIFYAHYHILDYFNIDDHGGCAPGWIKHKMSETVAQLRLKVNQPE